MGLSCGKVMALPQDWPCFDFELNKLETITDSKDEFEYKYKSETSLYTLEINLIGNHLIQIYLQIVEQLVAQCFHIHYLLIYN